MTRPGAISSRDPPMTRHRHPQLDDRGWLLHQYIERGRSSADIARQLRCGKTTVRDALRRHGLEKRRRGRIRRDDVSDDQVADLRARGWTLQAIGEELGVSTRERHRSPPVRVAELPPRSHGRPHALGASRRAPQLMHPVETPSPIPTSEPTGSPRNALPGSKTTRGMVSADAWRRTAVARHSSD
jgi:DNA-binding CsgD family transcriptional regulator